MDEKRLKQLMAVALEVDISLITDDASIRTIATWDSLQHLRLVMTLEEGFNVKFQDIEIPDLISFEAIKTILEGKTKSNE